jgi:hypothetical protein
MKKNKLEKPNAKTIDPSYLEDIRSQQNSTGAIFSEKEILQLWEQAAINIADS